MSNKSNSHVGRAVYYMLYAVPHSGRTGLAALSHGRIVLSRVVDSFCSAGSACSVPMLHNQVTYTSYKKSDINIHRTTHIISLVLQSYYSHFSPSVSNFCS